MIICYKGDHIVCETLSWWLGHRVQGKLLWKKGCLHRHLKDGKERKDNPESVGMSLGKGEAKSSTYMGRREGENEMVRSGWRGS